MLLIALALAQAAAAQNVPTVVAPVEDRQRPPQSTVIVEPVAMMIAAFDSDGDGKVTRAEFDAGVKHSFEAIDADHKGSLGYIAFADWAERWLGDRNAVPSPFEVDRDGDMKITEPELAERFDAYFARFDRDKDGVIQRKELLTVRTGFEGGPGGDRRKRRR